MHDDRRASWAQPLDVERPPTAFERLRLIAAGLQVGGGLSAFALAGVSAVAAWGAGVAAYVAGLATLELWSAGLPPDWLGDAMWAVGLVVLGALTALGAVGAVGLLAVAGGLSVLGVLAFVAASWLAKGG